MCRGREHRPDSLIEIEVLLCCIDGGGIVGVRGARLGDPVVGFAEGAAGAAAGEPGVEAAGVEGVAAGEAADFVVEFEVVEADGAGVAGFGVCEVGGNGGVDGVGGILLGVVGGGGSGVGVGGSVGVGGVAAGVCV